MRLRDIEFGPILDASGLRGFCGEGYAHHWLWKRFGFTLDGVTPVWKTIMARPHEGNMPLDPTTFRPKRFKPDCIICKFLHGAMLNAIGLSNPGVMAVLARGIWQQWSAEQEPFFVSFGHAPETDEVTRLDDTATFVAVMRNAFPWPRRHFGLQYNMSCVSAKHSATIEEERRHLGILGSLGVPMLIKMSILMQPREALALAEHPEVDGICVPNAVPWGSFPQHIAWKRIFGSDTSPLAKYGGGAYSGPELAGSSKISTNHSVNDNSLTAK